MKKMVLSLGAMLLAGAVLASCGKTSSLKVKAPNKGKTVDKVEYTTTRDFTFNKDDSFEDVFLQLNDSYDLTYKYTEDTYEFGYTKVSNKKSDISGKNAVQNDIIGKNFKYLDEVKYEQEVYQKNTSTSDTEKYLQYYTSYESEKEEITFNKDTRKDNDVDNYKYAGSYEYNESGERKIDYGKYNYELDEYSTKTTTGTRTNKDEYKTNYYLNKSEKPTDEDYGKTFSGYDKSGYSLEYTLRYFFNYANEESVNTYGMYIEAYKDLFDCSFELTDKYIILKSKTTYEEQLFDEFYQDYAYDHDSDEGIVAAYKNYFNKYYKGSSFEYELWINYTNKDNDNDTYLTCEYYKANKTKKMNMTIDYNEKYFDLLHVDDEDVRKELKGQQYVMKGTDTETYEVVANTNDYSKKIESLKKEIKKNNDYDGVDFKVTDNSHWM